MAINENGMLVQRQYIGARYVIKIYENSQSAGSAEWEATTNYEPLTLVTYNYGSYLSKKSVPATVGNPVDNPAYWVQTGFYNGQIADLQDQVIAINATLSEMGGDIDDIETAISTMQTSLNTLNNTTIPTIQSDITNLAASMVDVTEGPHVYSGSTNCSDNAIHQVATFELEANKLYYVYTSCQFEIAANSANGEHWFEMEASTNPNLSVFSRSRLFWTGDITQYVTNADARDMLISNSFIIKPAVDTTYYLYVRDYQSASATVNAYPCVQAINFD